MTAPYEKAKLAGYGVEFVEPPQTSSASGWDAHDPQGDQLESADKAGLWPTEAAAWEACDNHRMFGHTHAAQAGGEAQEPKTLDTRRALCASTAHLTLATCQMLSETPLASWPVYGGPMPDGFYVCATTRAESPHVPPDLLGVMVYARDLGFDYVQFDTDADPLDGLKVYDHDPRPPVDALEAFAKVRALFATWEGWSTYADGYDPAELLAAIAEAVGAELNGKPAAPVTDTLAEKMERYNDALGDLGISPNGDDFNALLDFAVGQPYREPHEKGR